MDGVLTCYHLHIEKQVVPIPPTPYQASPNSATSATLMDWRSSPHTGSVGGNHLLDGDDDDDGVLVLRSVVRMSRVFN
jgi:hypothetical protein